MAIFCNTGKGRPKPSHKVPSSSKSVVKRTASPGKKSTANRLQGPTCRRRFGAGQWYAVRWDNERKKAFHPTRWPKCLFLRLQKRPWSRLVKPYSSQRLMDRIWSHHLGTMFKIGSYLYRHSTYLHAPFYNLNTTTNRHRKNDGLPGRPKNKMRDALLVGQPLHAHVPPAILQAPGTEPHQNWSRSAVFFGQPFSHWLLLACALVPAWFQIPLQCNTV